MRDILQQIIADKQKTVALQKEAISIEQLEAVIQEKALPHISFDRAIRCSEHGIIAEFKRASPSKGLIHEGAKVEPIVSAYEANGASALSILTDELYFGGQFADVIQAREKVGLPILRKDFMLEEYQLYQAKAIGANAILLIASTLTVAQCKAMARKAQTLELEVLLELHTPEEVCYINEDVDVVGVNNRNLGSFETHVEHSIAMAKHLPKYITKISESGISHPATIAQLEGVGYHGFLIGERFMKTENPGKALAEFIHLIPS